MPMSQGDNRGYSNTVQNNKDKAQDSGNTRNFPSAKEVADFHRNSDVDRDFNSLHHTVGNNRFQVASGTHVHDGSSGQTLVDTVFAGDTGDPKDQPDILQAILGALTNVGAVNNTSQSSGKILAIQWGEAVITWGTTTTISANTVIPLTAGLFATYPTVMIVRSAGGTLANQIIESQVSGRTVSSFTMRAISAVARAATDTFTITWIAIGYRA